MSSDASAVSVMLPDRFSGTAKPLRRAIRHRFDVVSSSVPDLVDSIGGWLADRALAGWNVNVYLCCDQDVTPLRILGATPVHSFDLSIEAADWEPPTALAVERGIDTEELIRRYTDGASPSADFEIATWGPQAPGWLSSRLTEVCHELSGAARVFKGHALRAAGVGGGLPPAYELFRSGSDVSVIGRAGLTLCPADAVSPATATLASSGSGAGDCRM